MVILEEWLHSSYMFISTERADSQGRRRRLFRGCLDGQSACATERYATTMYILSSSPSKSSSGVLYPNIFLGRLLHQTSIWQICSFVKLSILQLLGKNLRI